MASRRDAVLSAAQQLLNEDSTASMTAIANAAGLSRATLHRHFDSREVLMIELGTRSLDQWEHRMNDVDIERAAGSANPGRIRSVLEKLIVGYVEDSDTFGFALTDHVILANSALVERTEALAGREAALFAAAQAAGVVRSDLPLRWLGHALYGVLVAGREAIRRGDIARRDLPNLVLSTLFQGVASP